MILDLSAKKQDRLDSLQMLMDEALRACNENDVHQLHVFVKDKNLARLLERKYGFRTVTDTVMVLEV